MRKILNIAIAVSAAIIFNSCGDFLKPYSPDLFSPKTANDLSEMLIGDAYPSKMMFKMQEFYSDDNQMREKLKITVSETDKSDFNDYMYLYSWYPELDRHISSSNNFYDTWTPYYGHILGCNAALDYLPAVEGAQDEKNRIEAEALTLRAFYYFHLVNLYGEPYNYNKKAYGVPMKLNSNLNINPLPRSSVEEVYAQILSDLKRAEELFLTGDQNLMLAKSPRAFLLVTYNMLSRVYLYMENWALAAQYASKIMDADGLTLYDLNSFVKTDKVPYPCFTEMSNPETFWGYGEATMQFTFSPYGNSTIVNPATNKNSTNSTRLFGASDELIDSFEENDLRKTQYLVVEWANNLKAPFPLEYRLYLSYSKANISPEHGLTKSDGRFGMSMRLGEVYLNYAEAAFHNNQPDKALKAINDLREKRYKIGHFTPLTTITLDQIKEERRREMCFEGHRWYDLRRWGMSEFSRNWVENGEITKTFKMNKNDAAYMVQIPRIVFDKTPNTPQNRLPEPKI